MLPEGLQYNSIANIAGFVKSVGMNVVRLTFAIEMIDDYFNDSPNQSLQATLNNALGAANGSSVLEQILSNNPQFTAESTRLDVSALFRCSVVMLTAEDLRCCCCGAGESTNLDASRQSCEPGQMVLRGG